MVYTANWVIIYGPTTLYEKSIDFLAFSFWKLWKINVIDSNFAKEKVGISGNKPFQRGHPPKKPS